MSVSSIAGTDTSSLAQSSSSAANQQATLDKDAFMKMLVTQMKNQDPMSPQDNQAFIAQLAQFSSLEQMQQLNQNILGLAVLQQTNALMSQLTQSSALIGQNVKYADPNDLTHELTGTVDKVKIKDGVATLEIGGHDVPLGNVTEILGGPASDGTSGDGTGTGGDGSGSSGS